MAAAFNLLSLATCLLLISKSFASTITAQARPNLLARQDQQALSHCSGFYAAESSCSSATPGFLSLDFTDEASCLCYQGTRFAPAIYDGYVATCVSYLATASPSFYSSNLGGTAFNTAPCAANGPVTLTGVEPPTNTNATSPATTSLNGQREACSSVVAIQDECSSETVRFGDLPLTSQAACLCYVSSTYIPQLYDGYYGLCLSYFKTANATLYESWVSEGIADPTPCASVGNVLNGPTATGLNTITSTGGGGGSVVSSTASPASTSRSTSRATSTSSSLVLTTAGSSTPTPSPNSAIAQHTAPDWKGTFVVVGVLNVLLMVLQ